MKFGHVEIEQKEVHPVKEKLKTALGGNAGIAEKLGRSGATNFDFWVDRDGTVWIGGNNSGGKEKKTSVDFYAQFPQYRPAQSDLASNHPAGWDPFDIPSDSDSDSD
jgi:hypothetical protein